MEESESSEVKSNLVTRIKCEPGTDLSGDDGFEFEYVMVKQETEERKQPIDRPEPEDTKRPRFKLSLCRICNKAFPNGELCVEHIIAAHPNELPYQCRICKKRFKTSQSRYIHERIHNPNRYSGPAQFKCDMCDKAYHFKTSLDAHRKFTHFGVPHAKWRKPTEAARTQCSRSGVKNPKLQRRRIFRCKSCSRKFTNQASLTTHEIVHTDATPFQCDTCPRAFNTWKGLDLHFRTVHVLGAAVCHSKTQDEFDCSSCTLKFTTFIDFKRHMHQVHKEPPFKCDMCPKICTSGFRLSRHRNRCHFQDNSGLRTYHCRICGEYQTKSWSTLNPHLKNVHGYIPKTSEDFEIYKSFACGVCEKPFSFGISAIICALTRHGCKDKARKTLELRWGIGVPKDVEESKFPLYKKLDLWPHLHQDVKKQPKNRNKTEGKQEEKADPTRIYSEEARSAIQKMISAKSIEPDAECKKQVDLNSKFLAATLSCFKKNTEPGSKKTDKPK